MFVWLNQLFEGFEEDVGMCFSDAQGWEEAYGRHASAAGKDVLLEEQALTELRSRAFNLYTYHQAAAAYLLYLRDLLQFINEVGAYLGSIGYEVFLLKHVEDGDGGGTCQVVSTTFIIR